MFYWYEKNRKIKAFDFYKKIKYQVRKRACKYFMYEKKEKNNLTL